MIYESNINKSADRVIYAKGFKANRDIIALQTPVFKDFNL